MLLQDHDQVMKQRDVPVGDSCVMGLESGGGGRGNQRECGGKAKAMTGPEREWLSG